MRIAATNTAEPPKALLILAFAAIYVLWGSTYLAIRNTVETLPPFLMAGVRALVAGLILFGLVGVPRMRRLTAEHWRAAAITGGLFFLGCHGLLFWMEQHTPSGIAALFLATIPGWMAILSHAVGGVALKAQTLAGLLLGLAGVALLILPTEHNTRSLCSPTSACVLLLSAMSWACGSLYSQAARLPEHTGTATAMQLLCGGSLAILVGLLIGEGSQLDPAKISTQSVLSLSYLVIFGSLVSFSAYTWLLRVAQPATVGTYAYVNPVAAVLLAWFLGGESLSSDAVAAAAVIVAGVVLIHREQNRNGRASATRQTVAREEELAGDVDAMEPDVTDAVVPSRKNRPRRRKMDVRAGRNGR